MTKEPDIPRISKTKEEDGRHVDIRYNGLNIYICPAKEFYYFEDDPFPEVNDLDIFDTYELMKFLGYADDVFGEDFDEEDEFDYNVKPGIYSIRFCQLERNRDGELVRKEFAYDYDGYVLDFNALKEIDLDDTQELGIALDVILRHASWFTQEETSRLVKLIEKHVLDKGDDPYTPEDGLVRHTPRKRERFLDYFRK